MEEKISKQNIDRLNISDNSIKIETELQLLGLNLKNSL